MQMGPDNRNSTPSPARDGEPDRRAFESFTVTSSDPFSRYILHYGVKAIAHAVLAHRALDEIENPCERRARLLETFRVRQSPLSFSLSGLRASDIITPSTALTASTVFWPDRPMSAERLEFAHPDLLNPLLAYQSPGTRTAIPDSFFKREWSKDDLRDRAAMSATLLVAERLWESCLGLFRRRATGGEILVGSAEQLVNHYSEFIARSKQGVLRSESLAAGETFLASLNRRDEEIAARVLEESRLAALAAESSPLEGTLPARPSEPPRQRATRRTEPQRSSLSTAEREEASNILRLRALRDLIHDPDAANRAEGQALLRRWQGTFSPLVEAELNRILRQAARIERWFARLETGLKTFEQGDTAEGIRLVREVVSHTDIPLIKIEARKLLKTFERVLTNIARAEEPSDEWPKSGARRRLVDVVQAAYNHGSDAEVICHDGLKRQGRLCFGGISPTAVKLLDFAHEITWDIDLTTIQSIKFFYDETPASPTGQSGDQQGKQ